MSEVKSLCGSEVRYVALEICDEQTDSDSSVIIVDEADALLRCNNLGISAMFGRESSTTVFVGTTNFKDMLAPAVARRFTFKVELDYLDVDGRCVFWKRFFGSVPRGRMRCRLNGLDRLTPGDFRTVRQELYYLGDDVSDDDRLDALEAELSAKTGQLRHIGFIE